MFATSDDFFGCFGAHDTLGDWEHCMESKVRAVGVCACSRTTVVHVEQVQSWKCCVCVPRLDDLNCT